jgi:hypothetical protein
MNTKKIILIVLFASSVMLLFMIWSARINRQKSDDILAKFKEVDNSLKTPGDSSSLNTGLISRNVNIASVATKAILFVDSLTVLVNNAPAESLSPLSRKQVEELKKLLLNFNSEINSPGVLTGDTLLLTGNTRDGKSLSWEEYYFFNTGKEAINAYLSFLKTKIVHIQGIKLQPE